MTINDRYNWPQRGDTSQENLTRMVGAAANSIYRDAGLQPAAQTGMLPQPAVTDAACPYYFMPDFRSAGLGQKAAYDVQAVRSDFPILRQQAGGYPLVWLDNAATTQKPQCVIDALSRYYSEYNSNIHRGAHRLARQATEGYEQAREKVRRFIGAASKDEVVFVRGTTEAINLVAASFGQQNLTSGDEIILTQMEHHSNIVPWQMLAQTTRAVIKTVPVDDSGALMLEQYERLFTPRTRLVAVTYVSNVLGTVNPVRQIADIAHRHGALVVVDAAQAVSHMPVNVQELDADFFAFSGHKMYGPTGIGVLYGRKELLCEMPPYQTGGGMIRSVSFEQTLFQQPPEKFEAGTGNIADAVGLGAAVDYLQSISMQRIRQYETQLTQHLMAQMCHIPGVCVIGTEPDKTSVVTFVMDRMQPDVIAKYLDQHGIAVRAGHHCAQPLARRFGLQSSVRASIGIYNTVEETDRFVRLVAQLAKM